MLYDPKWETTVAPVTQPDIYALATLIAWLEKQPKDKRYEFENCDGLCLLGQFWAAHGIAWYPGIYKSVERGGLKPDGWGLVIAGGFPRTFGAALERARERLANAE